MKMSSHAMKGSGAKQDMKHVDASASTSMVGSKLSRSSGKNDRKVTSGRESMNYHKK